MTRNRDVEEEEKARDSVNKDCPICYTVMVKPCKLPCSHLFCTECLELLRNKSFGQVLCPMCRFKISPNFKIEIDIKHQKLISCAFPKEFAKKKKVYDDLARKESDL